MFAAFEPCRSGYSWNFWDRAATILLEDLRLAGAEAYLLPAIERLKKLATKKWEPDERMGLACAMRADSLLAEAESARELLPMKNWWLEITDDRMQSLRRCEQPEHGFPVPPEKKDLSELGYVVNDTHTAAGSRAGRNMAHYLIESSWTADQSGLGQQYQRLIMEHEISLADDLYQELGRFGNRDESWNVVLARVLAHVDEDAALEDRDNRATTHTSQAAEPEDSALSQLPDGTVVRHRYQRGDYSGETIEAIVQGGRFSVEGNTQETRSPTGAARVAEKQLRGDEARGEGYNGWTWWEYETEDGDWEPINEITEG